MADLFELELHENDKVEEDSEDDAIEVDAQVRLKYLLNFINCFIFLLFTLMFM